MEKKSKKKKSKLLRYSLIIFLLLDLAFIGAVFFSPFKKHEGMESPAILTEIEINAPIDSVYRYLGNSDNASKWSVYVAKIESLNANSVTDGAVGSRRRCFGRQDASIQWDELITVSEKNKSRQLTIYNMKNFPLNANGLATEQNYTSLGKNKTKLVFTVFYVEEPTFGETMKTYFAAYKIKSVFEKNLKNIKSACEGGTPDLNS